MTQIQRNLLTNIANLSVNILVGLYYTPYLVTHLGLAAYGLVPLTLIVNQYINVLTGSLTGALSRFYTISIQQKDFGKASSIFSTIVILLGVIILLILPVIYLIISNIDAVFKISDSFLESARWLFCFTIFSFFISLYSSVLNITLYAQNRLDLMNVIKIMRIGLKLILVISFFECIDVNIMYVGLANLCTEILVLLFSWFAFIKYSPKEICLRLSLFSRSALSGIVGMSFWTIIHQLGDVGLYRVDNIIVNRHWGTELSGALGAISELGVYVTLVIGVVSSLFGPIILISYSRHEHKEVQKLTLTNSMVVGALTAIMVGCLIGYGKYFLCYWLGETYVIYSFWFVLKLLPLPFFAAAGIYAFVNRAWNKVKLPAIYTVLLGCFNVFVLMVLVYCSDCNSLNQVAWMLSFSACIIIVQSYGINSFFFNKSYPENGSAILWVFFKLSFVVVLSICVSEILLWIFVPTSLYEVILSLLVSGVMSLLLSVLFLFSLSQRQALLSIIKK